MVFPWGSRASAVEYVPPAPNLVFQLAKQNRSHPWLRVAADSSELDLHAGRLDAFGLSGLTPHRRGALVPERLGWPSISRIDEIQTAAHSRMIWGALLGGALGAGLGNAIGAGMRTTSTAGGYEVSNGHGGTGALLGLIVLGSAGAWAGAKLGERHLRERPWFVGVPVTVAAAPARSDTAAAVPPAAPSSDRVTNEAPTGAPDTTALARKLPDLSRSRAVRSACNRIGPDDLVRVRGDFGQFQGFVNVAGPEGLEGLRADPNRRREFTSPAPAGRVPWDRIDYVDKRGNSAGRGAVFGGVLLGVTGGLLAAAFVTAFDAQDYALTAGIEGGAMTGTVGVLLGALIGSAFPAWHNIYDGP
jgi:hypothetical protein